MQRRNQFAGVSVHASRSARNRNSGIYTSRGGVQLCLPLRSLVLPLSPLAAFDATMAALPLLIIIGIRLGLFAGCRLTLLPLLLGEARHASLDENASDAIQLDELPRPATTRPSRTGSSSSGSSSSSSPAQILSMVTDSLKDPHQASSHVFSLCFEESAILFALVLLEAMGTAIPHDLLRSNWTFSLFAVIALAVLLIPLGICLLVTFRFDVASPILKRALLALIPFVVWIVLFLRVPLPPATVGEEFRFLNGALSRTALLGVVLIALLSGSGATSAAWDTYEAFFAKKKPKAVTASELRDAEESFRRTCADLASRRRALESVQNAPLSEAERQQQAGFFSRMWAGSQRSKDIKSLSQEINGLEILASAMRDDLDSRRTRHRQALWSKTIQGRLLLGAGHLFSVYCVWRVLLAALSLVILGYRDQAPPDFVSLSLAYIVRLFNVDIDLNAWARIFGLLFVGALILIRLRVVLANLSTVSTDLAHLPHHFNLCLTCQEQCLVLSSRFSRHQHQLSRPLFF